MSDASTEARYSPVVQRASHHGASAGDVALATMLPAVSVIGGKAGNGGDLPPGQLTQLGQVGHQDRTDDRANPRHAQQHRAPMGERGIGPDQRVDRVFEVGDLLRQPGDVVGERRAHERVAFAGAAGLLGGPDADQVLAACHQGAQVLLGGSGDARRSRLLLGAEAGEEHRIGGVVLGPFARR